MVRPSPVAETSAALAPRVTRSSYGKLRVYNGRDHGADEKEVRKDVISQPAPAILKL
jgi:hypothetical protein